MLKSQWNMKIRMNFFVLFIALSIIPMSITIWRDGPESGLAQQGGSTSNDREQISLWNETLPLNQLQLANSDEAKEATNQTIISFPNGSNLQDASKALAEAPSIEVVNVSTLTGTITVNGTKDDTIGALADRGSRLPPIESSDRWFISSQTLPTGVDRIDAERPDTSLSG